MRSSPSFTTRSQMPLQSARSPAPQTSLGPSTLIEGSACRMMGEVVRRTVRYCGPVRYVLASLITSTQRTHFDSAWTVRPTSADHAERPLAVVTGDGSEAGPAGPGCSSTVSSHRIPFSAPVRIISLIHSSSYHVAAGPFAASVLFISLTATSIDAGLVSETETARRNQRHQQASSGHSYRRCNGAAC